MNITLSTFHQWGKKVNNLLRQFPHPGICQLTCTVKLLIVCSLIIHTCLSVSCSLGIWWQFMRNDMRKCLISCTKLIKRCINYSYLRIQLINSQTCHQLVNVIAPYDSNLFLENRQWLITMWLLSQLLCHHNNYNTKSFPLIYKEIFSDQQEHKIVNWISEV